MPDGMFTVLPSYTAKFTDTHTGTLDIKIKNKENNEEERV
jgi:hypothetical protein